MNRAEATCEICNELGLHLRAAAAFVKVAEQFGSDIQLERIVAELRRNELERTARIKASGRTQMRDRLAELRLPELPPFPEQVARARRRAAGAQAPRADPLPVG